MRAVITVTAVVFVALLLGLCTAADARECQTRNGGGGYWQYRIIDGKRCWYRGHSRLDKTDLHWRASRAPIAAAGASRPVLDPAVAPLPAEAEPPPVEPPPERKPTIAELVTWPDPPALDAPVAFGLRWGDMPPPVAEPPEIVTRGIEPRPTRAFAYAPEPVVDEDYRAPAALALVMVLMWLLMLPPILLVIFVLWRHRMDQIEVEPPRWRLVPWKS